MGDFDLFCVVLLAELGFFLPGNAFSASEFVVQQDLRLEPNGELQSSRWSQRRWATLGISTCPGGGGKSSVAFPKLKGPSW